MSRYSSNATAKQAVASRANYALFNDTLLESLSQYSPFSPDSLKSSTLDKQNSGLGEKITYT